MAIVWGSYVNNFRLGIDIVGTTWIVYGESNAYGHDWNYTLQFGGSWGSGTKSGHFYSGWGQTVRRELHRTTRPNSTQSNNVRLTSALVNGAYVSRGLTVTPKPSAPRIDRVVRNSDTSHRVEWTRYATATSVRLERRTNGGSWQHVSSVSSNAASITDTTTRANNRYQYRVRVANAGGTSDWSNLSNTVYTTPAVPSGVTATRVGDDIRVNGSVSANASHVDIQDDGTSVSGVVAKGSLPWTHSAPDPLVTHRYRMRARVDSNTSNNTLLTSAYSAYSATVQLTAPPNAPTGLSPNGAVVESGASVSLSWTHNPVDSSVQTAYELRYRLDGGAWTTLSGTTAGSRAVTFGTGVVEWQVRTKGAHPDWSSWSAVATVTAVDRPTVAIVSPDGGQFFEAVLPVSWSFFQGQGRPQSSWRARLLRDGQLLETKQGTGSATSTTFSTRLEDGYSYTVEVDAASGSIWSAVESVTVDASFILPAPAVLEGVWNDGTGAVDLQVSVLDQPPHADVVNYVPRIEGDGTYATVAENLFTNPRLKGDDTWAEVRRNYVTEGAFTSVGRYDIEPEIVNGDVWYRVTRISDHAERRIFMLTGVNPDVPVGAALEVWNTLDEPMTLRLQMGSSLNDGPSEAFDAGERRRIEAYWPSLTGSPNQRLNPVLPSNMAQGDSILVRFAQVENTVSLGPYFDGSTPDFSVDPDMRTRWLGEPNASGSVMEIERVRGLASSNTIAGVSTWEGKPAVRVIALSQSTDSYVRFNIPESALALGTAIGTRGTLEDTLGSGWLGLWAGTPSQIVQPPVPTPAGSYPFRNVFSGITAVNQVRLYHGGKLGDPDVWWTDIGLYAGNYQGNTFTGDDDPTVTGLAQPEDFRIRWTGTPGNSTSVLEIERVAGFATMTRAIPGMSSKDGKPAVRLISTGDTNNDSFVGTSIPENARSQGTGLATLHIDEPLAGSLNALSRRLRIVLPEQTQVVPNMPGVYSQRVHFATTSVHEMRLMHGGLRGSGDVWWTDLGLFEGDYQGDYFDGDTEWVQIDGVWMHTRWNSDGTSTASMPDTAVSMTVERSTDDGNTWTPVLVDETGVVQVADYESLSNGVTVYRVTTFAATGAATVREYPVPADSMKVWLGAGQGFGDTAGLPYDPTLGLAPERERGMWRLAGNTRVAWAGEQAGTTVAAAGRLIEGDEYAQYDDLSRIFLSPEPVHLYRNPLGQVIYGVLTSPDLQRAPGVGVWSYGFQIEEADKE